MKCAEAFESRPHDAVPSREQLAGRGLHLRVGEECAQTGYAVPEVDEQQLTVELLADRRVHVVTQIAKRASTGCALRRACSRVVQGSSVFECRRNGFATHGEQERLGAGV